MKNYYSPKTVFFLFLFVGCILASGAFSQGTWSKMSNFPGTPRSCAASFVIGSKAYVGTGDTGISQNGHNPMQDFWSWDIETNLWSKIADFPGAARSSAFSFSIGNKGYVGSGWAGIKDFDDFYQYDPATDTWTKMADFPGSWRENATSFVINGIGYVGVGYNGGDLDDFWKYDTASKSWTLLNAFPAAPRRDAVGFAIGNKGYLVGGYDDANCYGDTWEYDPTTDSWLQKADFGGLARHVAGAFAIGTKAYVGTGACGDTYKDFWQWDQSNNTWTQIGNYSGAGRAYTTAFAIGCKGFVGLGLDSTSVVNHQDMWEYYDTTNAAYCLDAGINEVAQNTSWNVYPNPFENNLVVKAGNTNQRIQSIEIFDLLGRKVFNKTSSEFTNSISLDLSFLSEGMYYMRIKQGGADYIQKITRQ